MKIQIFHFLKNIDLKDTKFTNFIEFWHKKFKSIDNLTLLTIQFLDKN